MSDERTTEGNADAREAATILAELRTWREREGDKADNDAWTARLTLREIDTLLAIADERDALRRQACEMPSPRGVEIPPGHALVRGEIVPLPAPVVHYPRKYQSGAACGADALTTTMTFEPARVSCPECLRLLGHAREWALAPVRHYPAKDRADEGICGERPEGVKMTFERARVSCPECLKLLGRTHEWAPAAACTDVEALATACRRCGAPLVPDVNDRAWETRDGLAALRARTDCDA